MNTTATVTFPISALKRFGEHLVEIAHRDLGMTRDTAASFSQDAHQLLSRDGDFTRLSALLASSGIRDRWNKACAKYRATELAKWIAPHVRGRLMDLLSGDGRIGENLASNGADVLLVERPDVYDVDHSSHSAPFRLFDEDKPLPMVDTVLLSTVLHHEPDADGLLQLAAKSARRRLILVENCLESEHPSEFQEFMDLFFNHCLNHTGLDSPMNHRTEEQWIQTCAFYGVPVAVDRKERLPGIPLSHHLIVIETK
ncbi:MAG TPA: hypothetical protein VJU77_16775 [Chthoniobacterales bacterium]|nr:hypothetical protein [Chthoniobacterales bacterium]